MLISLCLHYSVLFVCPYSPRFYCILGEPHSQSGPDISLSSLAYSSQIAATCNDQEDDGILIHFGGYRMDTQHSQVKDVQFGDEASPKSSVPLLQSLIGDRNITRSFV